MEEKIIERIKYLLMSAEALSIDIKKDSKDLENLLQTIKEAVSASDVLEEIKESRLVGTYLSLKTTQLTSTNKIISELFSLLRINVEAGFYEDKFNLEEFQILKEVEKHHSAMFIVQGGEARFRSKEVEDILNKELGSITSEKSEEYFNNIKNTK